MPAFAGMTPNVRREIPDRRWRAVRDDRYAVN
jgi:hypothetical protein